MGDTCSACQPQYTYAQTCGNQATCSRTCGNQPTCGSGETSCQTPSSVQPVAGGVPAGEIARYKASGRSAAQLKWKADGSLAFFASEGEGLRSLAADSGQINVVTGNRDDWAPVPGPAARVDAFAYLRGGQMRMWDGGGDKTHNAGLGWKFSACAWSPGGDSIVFAASGLLGNRLGVYDVTSGDDDLFDWERGADISHLIWPAESDHFFVVADLNVSGRAFSSIMAGAPGEKKLIEVATVPGTVEALVAAPDGGIVYFLTNKIIYAFNRQTGAQTIVTDRAGDALVISPDGRWLLTNPAGIAVVAASGGRLKQIVSAAGVEELAWSSRGQIAALVTFGGQMDIWTFRVDDSILN